MGAIARLFTYDTYDELSNIIEYPTCTNDSQINYMIDKMYQRLTFYKCLLISSIVLTFVPFILLTLYAIYYFFLKIDKKKKREKLLKKDFEPVETEIAEDKKEDSNSKDLIKLI